MAGEQSNLGALRVSLGLDSAQFTQSMGEINRKIKAVKSEFEAASDGTKAYAQSVEGLAAKNDMLSRQMELQKTKIAELKRQYEIAAREKGADAAETQNLLIAYNKAIGAMNKTESALSRVSSALNEQTDKAKKAEKSLSEFGEKAKGIGGTFSTTLSPAIGAFGIGMLKVADDADGSSSRIQKSLGLTEGAADKLAGTARDIWEQGFGENMEEVEAGLLAVKKNFKDLNETDLKQVTKDTMALADVMDADVNEVTRAGSNLMKGFGIDSEKAFDLMAWGGQKGLNFSQEMFDNLSEYAPLYKDMGFSADEYFQMLQKGSESGVYNLDYINDAMKEFQVRAKDGSKGVAEAMDGLSKSTQNTFEDFNNGKATVKELHNAVIGDLKGMDDQVAANQIGVALYGTKFEDLEADSMYAMGNINGAIKGVDGAMAASGKNVEKTFGEKLQITWRKAQSALVPLGEELLKVANDVLPPIIDGVEWATEKFSEMSPVMKNITIGVGAFAAAVGPAIVFVGTLAGAIAPLIPMFGGAAGGAGILAGGLAILTGPVGLTVAAIAALTAGGVALYKNWDKIMELPGPLKTLLLGLAPGLSLTVAGIKGIQKANEEVLPSTAAFSDAVSKGTSKSITSYLDLENKATTALKGLSWSGQKVTKEMADKIYGHYEKMGDSILSEMDKNHAEQLKKRKKLFEDNDALSEKEEEEINKKTEKKYESDKKKVKNQEAQIKKILDNAAKEKRALTEKEQKQIDGIREEMRKTAVKTMSKSEKEQVAIMSSLKTQSGKLSASQAAEIVRNSVKAKDGSVKEAEKTYKGTKKQIEYMRDVTGELTEKQAAKMIKEAEKTRSESVKKAEDMNKKVVKSAKNQAEGHIDKIDWETGKVKTGWDKMEERVDDAVDWFKGLFGGGSSKKKSKKSTSKRANGTPSGRHTQGVALVGEEGPELAHLPGQGLTMLGMGGQHLADLPTGTSVLPHRHTKQVMKQYGIPMYADGIGDYFDTLMKGPKAVWGAMTSKFNIGDSLIPSWTNKLTGSPTKAIGSMLTGGIKGLIGDMFSGGGNNPVGAGVERWRGTVMQALAMNGLPTSGAYVNAWLRQIKSESGGNPNAVQSTAVKDINYYTGNLARGLVQVIPPTFRAFAFPGHGNQMNGLDSLLAGMNYAKSRYGAASMLKYVGHGHGYAKGGVIDREQVATVGEGGKKEIIIPLEQHRGRALSLWKQAGEALGMFKAPTRQPINKSLTGGSAAGQSTNITNNYEINVEYTGTTEDINVKTLAKKIKTEIEREDRITSRAAGVMM